MDGRMTKGRSMNNLSESGITKSKHLSSTDTAQLTSVTLITPMRAQSASLRSILRHSPITFRGQKVKGRCRKFLEMSVFVNLAGYKSKVSYVQQLIQ
ncbi:hypothetical protein DPMN_011464 [Dreissena polymorpha]|uniref:Uncharacterized protein n=1 Tax=Dreissena polymorpha TaxID=45954 RepID=A0A9D4S2I4_DREPO|nr:hypothetical protein DPMN_011464 [Dreissena polymorpha]